MRRFTGAWFVCAAVALLLSLDQLSKLWVQNNLSLYATIDVIPNFFQLAYYANHGALGGIGWHFPLTIPILIVGSAMVIVLLALLYRQYTRLVAPSFRVELFVALATAPLLSHGVDRLRQGYVVDFLHFGGLPVFNLADVMPHIAMILLAFEAAAFLRMRRQATLRLAPQHGD